MPLGKGLGAYFSSMPIETVEKELETNNDPVIIKEALASGHLREIAIANIHANPTQPRRHFDELALQDLASSIQEHGILQPITVRDCHDGTFEIIAGERRFRASQMAGLASIPALIKGVDPKTQLELALIENIQREDLNAVEEATSYQRLVREFGQTQDDVARRVGKSRSHIANMIRLLDLPSEIQKGLIEGLITHTKARALLGLRSTDEQLRAYHDILHDKTITTRETERATRVARGGGGRRDAVIEGIENNLREKLGTKVYVSYSKGRGSLKIDFYSDEELAGILKKIG